MASGNRRRWRRSSGVVCERVEPRTLMAATAFRPPSVPLVVNSPYLSVWSDATNATDDVTREWDGTAQPIVSLVRIDGVTSRLLGETVAAEPAFPQTGLQVTPTRTIYDFDNGHVHVTMTFTTPVLPNNLDALSRPITYLSWDVHAVDGKSHNVQVYASVGSELATTNTSQTVAWGRAPTGSLEALHVGTVSQQVFDAPGDRVGIDWGNAYLAGASGEIGREAVKGNPEAQALFEASGYLNDTNDAGTRAPDDDEPVMAFSYALGNVSKTVVSRHVLVGYDSGQEIDYFGERLVPYWKRNGATFPQLLATAETQYASLVKQCVAFDAELTTDLTSVGGSQYAQVAALAYRQSFASTGLAADKGGHPLLFTKEQSSNGDIATADVIFPTSPILFTFNPTLARASLVPLLQFASSSMWTQSYAPHDLGTYPQALGEPSDGEEQPVEESGNLLIMADAEAQEQGSPSFINTYWSSLTKWAQYLQPYAYDPGDQLTTDDFLGTIDHSVNLAIKAIEGLGAYAQLAKMRGDTADYTTYMNLAKSDVTHLLSVATDGNHLELAYNDPGTWSEKYNLVWDGILGLNLFPTSVAANEVAYYKTQEQAYGVPLESTTETAKADWETWAATLATNNSDFESLFAPVYNYLNTTPDRTPFTDAYQADDNTTNIFTARSVVGGLFIRLMDDPTLFKKYRSMDTADVTTWSAFPTETTILPTGSTWKYTTATPADNWTAANFNDAAWATGQAGFGTAGTPSVDVRTTWNTGDIYLRKTIKLPSGSLNGLSIYAFHDEDMQVYVNGVQAVSVGGYVVGYQLFDISSAALAVMKPGATVTIAVHCHQTVGGQGIDVGLVNAS